jgi:formate C-acetyltransferase
MNEMVEKVKGMNESTERIKRLREKLIATDPIVCPERALIWTEVYRNNEDKQPIIKAALALKETLSRMTVNVYEDELIVGNQGSALRAAPLHPQTNLWFMEELDTFPVRDGSKYRISEETKEKLREALDYWRGKTVYENTMAILPEETKDYMDTQIFTCNYTLTKGTGHFIIGFDTILKKGYEGIRAEAEAKLGELDLANPHDMDKILFTRQCNSVRRRRDICRQVRGRSVAAGQ